MLVQQCEFETFECLPNEYLSLIFLLLLFLIFTSITIFKNLSLIYFLQTSQQSPLLKSQHLFCTKVKHKRSKLLNAEYMIYY